MRTKKQPRLVTSIVTLALIISVCGTFTFSRRALAQSGNDKTAAQRTARNIDANYPILSRYAVDITQLALNGKLEAPHGLEAETERVIGSLSKSNRTTCMH